MNTLLILDEASVASAAGVSFHLNQAVKHLENPLLLPGESHEWDNLQIHWPCIVLRDPQDGLFRCWYHSLSAIQADYPAHQPGFPWEVGYAESADGIHWTKPALGQSLFQGRPTNRLANDFDGWCLSVVFPNPDPTDPRKKYLSIWKNRDTFEKPDTLPRVLAASPDGKRWTLENPGFYQKGRNVAGQDFWQVLHEPDAPAAFRIKAYGQYHVPRAWDGRVVRQISLHHGPTLGALRDVVVLAPEQGIDEELHFASVTRTGNTYVMLFESDRFSKPLHGDLRLAVSADGVAFRRVHARTPVVPTGPKGSWDENMLVSTSYSFLEVGDELWIYYIGSPNLFRTWPMAYNVHGRYDGQIYPNYLGLATLPRDRYGYATGPGTVTTHPLTVATGDVWLNAEGAGVTIALLDQRDQTVATGSLGDERQQTVYRRIRWDRPATRGDCRLRITLAANTKLFSVRW